jgi:curved DNA-binding protein CbpA
MVAQRSPSLYELLEVSSSATFEEIEQSYQRIAAYLGAESLAVYSILDSDDAHSARAQLDEAYRTLSDPDRRAAYDRARKEEASYPSMMVPAASGGSTSTADADIGAPARSSGQAERDKRLPVTGRSQARQPIRGPGARTGRMPLYGRDVGRSSKAAEPAAEPKKKPLYGRAQPRGASGGQQTAPEPKSRYSGQERSGRWTTRAEDTEQRYDAPLPPPSRELADEDAELIDGGRFGEVPVHAPPERGEMHGEAATRDVARSESAMRGSARGERRGESATREVALGESAMHESMRGDANGWNDSPRGDTPPRQDALRGDGHARQDSRGEAHDWQDALRGGSYGRQDPSRGEVQRLEASRGDVHHEPAREHARSEAPRGDGALRNDPMFADERPELVKTVSDVVEPRKRSTLPPPAQLSASAKAKRRVLSPSIAM